MINLCCKNWKQILDIYMEFNDQFEKNNLKKNKNELKDFIDRN